MANTPGKFHFKVKSYDNEEGEYSAWEQAEPGTIIQFILNHWFNETLPNNLDIIVIKNAKGDQLIIDHENKDVFRFFLLPVGTDWSYYYKMTDIRFMFFTLEHFFSGLLDVLKDNLNKTMDDFRWVKGDFIGKDFHFIITRGKVFKHFIGGIGILLAALLLVISAAIGLGNAIQVIFFSVFILAYSLWTLPKNISWYLDQKDLAITLSKGDRFIHIWLNGQKKSIPKTEILSIQQHFTRDNDSDLWIPMFTQIDFANGDTLNLSNLIMPQDFIREKFLLERNRYHEVHSGKTKVQKKTNLGGYFPKARQGHYSK